MHYDLARSLTEGHAWVTHPPIISASSLQADNAGRVAYCGAHMMSSIRRKGCGYGAHQLEHVGRRETIGNKGVEGCVVGLADKDRQGR